MSGGGNGRLGSSALAAEESSHRLSERIAALEDKMDGRISLSGAVEVEAGYTSHNPAAPGEKDEEESDISLSTVDVGVDAELNQYVSGHVLFLYEEGENDDDVTVDEGYVLLDGKDHLPAYLKAGKEYVPFGRFDSNMISDPLTLELGEIQETALEVGFKAAGFYGAVYGFKGDDVDLEEDNTDHVNNFGLAAGYAVARDDFSFDMGAGWINNILESGGLEEDWAEAENNEAADAGYASDSISLDERISGASIHAALSAGPISFFAEYVAMLDDPDENFKDSVTDTTLFETTQDAIETFNLEVGYTFDLTGRETVLAAAWQGATNAGDWLPEDRYLVSAGMELFKETTLALEYYHDEFETDDSGDGVTAQLAIGF